jgi:hypothetical protein
METELPTKVMLGQTLVEMQWEEIFYVKPFEVEASLNNI